MLYHNHQMKQSKPHQTVYMKQASHNTIFSVPCIRSITTRNRRGSCHLTEIGTLEIQPLPLHNFFLAIAYCPVINRDLSELFEQVQNVTTACDSLYFFNCD